MNSGLVELENLFFQKGKGFPKHVRLFLPTENGYLYVNNGQARRSLRTYGVMGSLSHLERGPVLDKFAEFEFLLNEFLRFVIIGFETNSKLLDIIVRLPVNQKIRYLNDWKSIGNELATDLRRLFQIRDGFAHKFDEKDTQYDNKPISQSFSKFVEDMQKTWGKIIFEYNKIIENYDYLVLIQEIKEFQKEK